MGDGFTVDYDALDQMGDSLQTLANQFDGMRDTMDEYADAVASDDVADKLDRVAKNWSDDREEIVETMENAAGYATQAAAAYRDADMGLASEYDSASGSGE